MMFTNQRTACHTASRSTSLADMHPLHGAALGVALYLTGVASLRTAVLVGGAATAYMTVYGHALPGGM